LYASINILHCLLHYQEAECTVYIGLTLGSLKSQDKYQAMADSQDKLNVCSFSIGSAVAILHVSIHNTACFTACSRSLTFLLRATLMARLLSLP
jgi:hypothetical protein